MNMRTVARRVLREHAPEILNLVTSYLVCEVSSEAIVSAIEAFKQLAVLDLKREVEKFETLSQHDSQEALNPFYEEHA